MFFVHIFCYWLGQVWVRFINFPNPTRLTCIYLFWECDSPVFNIYLKHILYVFVNLLPFFLIFPLSQIVWSVFYFGMSQNKVIFWNVKPYCFINISIISLWNLSILVLKFYLKIKIEFGWGLTTIEFKFEDKFVIYDQKIYNCMSSTPIKFVIYNNFENWTLEFFLCIVV